MKLIKVIPGFSSTNPIWLTKPVGSNRQNSYGLYVVPFIGSQSIPEKCLQIALKRESPVELKILQFKDSTFPTSSKSLRWELIMYLKYK